MVLALLTQVGALPFVRKHPTTPASTNAQRALSPIGLLAKTYKLVISATHALTETKTDSEMFDLNSLSGQNLKGPCIGAVQVNKTFTYTNRSYECAAWSEDREALKGVHPVYIARQYHVPRTLYVLADIAAKVTDDFFPALWCGVAVSNDPYKPKHIGEDRIIHSHISVEDAITSTGNSPGSDLDWFIHPSWWQVFTEESIKELKEAYRRLPEFWRYFDSLKEESFKPQMDGRWSFDDEYRSKVGMIAHFGSELEHWARRIEKINWQSQYHRKAGKYNTDYQRENFAKNTEWTKAIPIKINE
jgi:hypothetical protein